MSKFMEKPTTPQETTRQEEAIPAPAFGTIEDLKLNFPFMLPEDISEGRTAEEAEKVRKVLEEAHHKFMEKQKNIDDVCRGGMDRIGSMYTLQHQRRLIGNSGVRWLEKVGEWQEGERRAKTAGVEEVAELQRTNPLVKLLIQKPAPTPEPKTKPAKAVRRKQVVVESESEEEQAAPEEEEEEQQFYVPDLDTYIPVELVELALGDPAGNEESMEEQGETQGMGESNLAIVPAGEDERAAPAEVEEMEQQEEEQPLLVYRRRSRRSERGEVRQPSMIEELEMPAAPKPIEFGSVGGKLT